ncbi:MAG: DUF6485 family protein [Planctomycetota bacterium]
MKKECPNNKSNLAHCNCTYTPCSRKGTCCECLHYHRQNNELPACFFPNDVEKTYDRSFERFIKIFSK